MEKMKRIVGYVLGVLGILGIDCFTKYLAQVHLGDRRIPIIGEFVQLRYVVNTGLSFSMFAGNKLVTTLTPLLAMVGMLGMHYFFRVFFKKREERKAIKVLNLSAVFIVAGFVGNYAERLVNGGVIDFVSVKGFAVFNVADIYCTVWEIVVICMAIWMERIKKKEKKSKKECRIKAVAE